MHFTSLRAFAIALLACCVAAAPVEIDPIDPASIDTALIDTALGSPNPNSSLEKRIAHNKQSCILGWGPSFLAPIPYYFIYVGIYYNKGTGCDSLKKGLSTANGGHVYNWQCKSYDNGQSTLLLFTALPNHGPAINAFLHKAYPTVDKFNCPSMKM